MSHTVHQLWGSHFSRGVADIVEGWRRRELWTTIGLQDIRHRYRRSIIGPLWITLSMGIMVAALGVLYGTIFKQNLADYLPFLSVGFILWNLISAFVTEGSRVFVGAEGLIRQLPAPMSTHVYRFLWGHLIAFAHNIWVYIIVIIWFGFNPGWTVLLFFPAVIILLINGFWVTLLAGMLSARFRDIPLVLASIIQVMFFITPVIWRPEMLPGRALVLEANPFYHFIEILRAPLLGSIPNTTSWIFVAATTICGWGITLWFFGAYRWRIAYWV